MHFQNVGEEIDYMYEQKIEREIQAMIDKEYKLNDNSPFPFGRYQGCRMDLVPLTQYHFIWNETTPWTEDQRQVLKYIKDRLPMFKTQNPQLTWKDRL